MIRFGGPAPFARVLAGAVVVAWALVGCGEANTGAGDRDLGPIDATLTVSDRINWPGLDVAGGRMIPFVRSFGEGRAAGYWFLSFGSRDTADSFWFCRQGDTQCPLDEHRRLNWNNLVGHPLFTRIPGDPQASSYWSMWKVTVPDNYVPDSIKTVETLNRLADAGALETEPFVLDFGKYFGENVGPQDVVLHAALVLENTTLERNGEAMPDGSGPMLPLERRRGWHRGYRVHFIDFSPSDGVFPPATDGAGARPRMRFANIYILWRLCASTPRPSICDLPGFAYADRRPVSERGLGQDITGNGSSADTNNVMGSMPCELKRLTERPYSPLWAPQAAVVGLDRQLDLIDTSRDATRSDVDSADQLFDHVAAGIIERPTAMREDETGNPVPGNDGQVFFNCPAPVPVGFVPHPCRE